MNFADFECDLASRVASLRLAVIERFFLEGQKRVRSVRPKSNAAGIDSISRVAGMSAIV